MKLWLRITLTITLLSMIAAGLIAFFVNDKVKENLNTAYFEWSNTLSKSIAQSILGYTIEGDVEKTQDILRRITKDSYDIEYIIVVGFSNELFASTLNVSKLPENLVKMDHAVCDAIQKKRTTHNKISNGHIHELENVMSSSVENGIVDYMHPLVKNLGGHMHLGLKNSIVKNTTGAIEKYSIVIALIISFVGFLVAIFLAKKISLPIEELSNNVSKFGKTGTSPEINIKTSDSDIMRLVSSFSRMLEERVKYEKEISNYKIHLEELVNERTVQLEKEVLEHEVTEKKLFDEKQISDKANKTKSDFLSHMSHELRTPLNAVIGFSQLLADYDDPEVKDYSNEILNAGYHLLSLINDVLDLSRIEAGKLSLSIEEVIWNEVVDECYVLLLNDIDNRKINYFFDSNDKTYIVNVDRVRLKQAVLNFMSNAVKYNEDSGSIRVFFEVNNSTVRLSVKDSGIGIPEDKHNKVFVPFDRLDLDKSAIDGVGIGLVITKELIKSMGGTLGFKSELGFGSVFWMEFELVRIEHNESIDSNSMVKNKTTEMNSGEKNVFPIEGNLTVLYIEDNPSNMKVVDKIFQRFSNIIFYPASLPSEGLDILKKTIPDLILLDINLPEMDGYEVKKILDSTPEYKNILVIGLSANAMQHDIDKSVKHGFTDYLAKPIILSDFLESIKKAVLMKSNK